MAQLRDAKTSELIAEGTPLEVALAAGQLGKGAVVGVGEALADDVEVIFDDVGLGFDPAAVIAAHQENVDGLAAVSQDAKADAGLREAVTENLAAAEAEADVGDLVDEAGAAMEEARAKASAE